MGKKKERQYQSQTSTKLNQELQIESSRMDAGNERDIQIGITKRIISSLTLSELVFLCFFGSQSTQIEIEEHKVAKKENPRLHERPLQ